jgi:hypothetical protein
LLSVTQVTGLPFTVGPTNVAPLIGVPLDVSNVPVILTLPPSFAYIVEGDGTALSEVPVLVGMVTGAIISMDAFPVIEL